jgi:CubicO group peptidase (beta-lactamase class C family)
MIRQTLVPALALATLAAALTPALAPLPAAAQAVDLARIDAIFSEWDRPGSPGCGVSVLHHGRTVLARGYGSANLDYDVPITPSTSFYLASVSKQFTAAAVALAAEQGFLSLDDDVRAWFSELPDYGRVIRVRDLVHHTSGLRDYLALMTLAGMPFGNQWRDAELLALIARQRALNFEPGAEYLYSNSGYFLLSELVRRATGLSLRAYADRELFQPLGMHATWFHDDAGEVVRHRAVAYAPGPDGGFRITHLFNFDKVGSGGLYSNLEDLARWDANFYESRIGGDGFLATLHTRGVLTSGDTLDYAFGLRVADYRGARTVDHGGSMMGFRTALLRFPDEHATVITLCNLGTIDAMELARNVAGVVLQGRLGPAPAPARAADDDARVDPAASPRRATSALAEYVGRYVSDELLVTYELAEGDGTLQAIRPDGAKITLTPLGEDRFRADGGASIQFVRDGTRITAFVLDAGRVRDLRFQRENPLPGGMPVAPSGRH